ncbi:GNAT family N-acetyltransferase [Bacillus aerolatus]|uniref:GNAT family N-acetyltransferase n=1 Tax=Bacillus aerolatus TaxID=2653354 RepID=A0A6I1FE52_9BACI|nr:GNAT family N-acetyltransferase [Bacillus aerolatus]KAB7705981.1 GNAT family N-acetyltransferase [Bacillus aerolatus]
MKPILLEFPTEFYSKRLQIRLPKPGDGRAIHEAIEASREELKMWLPFAWQVQTEKEMEANVREAHAKFLTREDLRYHIFLKDTGEFVASSGLHRINWVVPKFEIGYWIDTRFSGQGYMTEAVKAITGFAFNELNARRVEIRCDEKNSKSRAIPEKLGFHLDGILFHDDLSIDGKEVRNTCIYSKIR